MRGARAGARLDRFIGDGLEAAGCIVHRGWALLKGLASLWRGAVAEIDASTARMTALRAARAGVASARRIGRHRPV
jgi:hypothetical protein